MAGETTNPDFDALGVHIPAWDEATFRESPSQESESLSSSSSWELTSEEVSSMEIAMGAYVDMGLQFPSVDVDTIGDGSGIPTEDEFLRAILEVVQSTPKVVRPLFCVIVPSVRVLIQLILVGSTRCFSQPRKMDLNCFARRASSTCEREFRRYVWSTLVLGGGLIDSMCSILPSPSPLFFPDL